MTVTRRAALGSALALGASALALPGRGRAQADPAMKLGVLTDLSGPYRDTGGPGSVACARQAAAEAEQAFPGLRVEVVQADHQNKADVGAAIVRQWFDREGVDAVIDVPNSSVGLAVSQICREKDKAFLASGAATSDLTGPQCAPTTVQWTFDSYVLARSTGRALVEAGKKDWFFLTANYTFGQTLEREATALIQQAGGKVVGSVSYPFPQTTDFSSFLLQAQSSRADVLGLANAGADTINAIKQAGEFGITGGGTTIAAMLMFIPDVHALGLQTAAGLVLTETFYWDLNDRTRACTARLMSRMGTNWRPDMEHAGSYAVALHYLKAAQAMGAAEAKKSGSATVARMKAMPTDDDAFGPGRIREDGRKLQPAYLFQVKTPDESKGPWDYYKLLATTLPDQAARPLGQGGCPMIRA